MKSIVRGGNFGRNVSAKVLHRIDCANACEARRKRISRFVEEEEMIREGNA